MDPNTQTPYSAPPAWSAPQAASGGTSPIVKILISIAAIILIGGAVLAFRTLTDGPAKIEFTTTDPAGYEGCKIKDKVDSVAAGTDVWMVIQFKSTMDERVIDVTVTKDGEDYDAFYYDDASGYGCISEIDPLSDLEPGAYKFTATIEDKVEAEGSLVVE
jgi:hypothetical protein